MCWSIGGSDSSIVANWAVGINDDTPLVLGYVDAYGNAVNVVGGTLVIGYCNSGGGSVSNVSITDNFDGTYTAIVNADTTLIRTDVCGDTITQVAHGFSVGDLLGQTAGNGSYFLANTATAENFPVTAVIDSIDANTFVGCNEKVFVTFEHGLPLGRDYFLQDDGSLDTIPDSTYNVFAFRTLKINKAYFDIPELVVSLEGGGAGGGSGTGDADWYDVLTGAPPTSITDDIYTDGLVGIGVTTPEEELHIDGNILFENYYLSTIRSKANLGFGVTNGLGGYQELLRLSHGGSQIYYMDFYPPNDSKIRIFNNSDLQFQNPQGRVEWKANSTNTIFSHITQNTSDQIIIDGRRGVIFDGAGPGALPGQMIQINNIPTYANDAAADADADLPSGGLYQITGDRTLYIKP